MDLTRKEGSANRRTPIDSQLDHGPRQRQVTDVHRVPTIDELLSLRTTQNSTPGASSQPIGSERRGPGRYTLASYLENIRPNVDRLVAALKPNIVDRERETDAITMIEVLYDKMEYLNRASTLKRKPSEDASNPARLQAIHHDWKRLKTALAHTIRTGSVKPRRKTPRQRSISFPYGSPGEVRTPAEHQALKDAMAAADRTVTQLQESARVTPVDMRKAYILQHELGRIGQHKRISKEVHYREGAVSRERVATRFRTVQNYVRHGIPKMDQMEDGVKRSVLQHRIAERQRDAAELQQSLWDFDHAHEPESPSQG